MTIITLILVLLLYIVIILRILKKKILKSEGDKLENELRERNHNYDIHWSKPRRADLLNRISIGEKSYGFLTIEDTSESNSKLQIGSYCSIARNVCFLLGSEHPLHTLTTYPIKVKKIGQKNESLSKGDIIIKDDVWIGLNAIICSGVTIGQGAVIAAGAVVTKDVPPYAIVGGSPAKIIKYRFSQTIIDKLCNTNIKEILDKITNEKINTLYTDLNENNIDEIINKLSAN